MCLCCYCLGLCGRHSIGCLIVCGNAITLSIDLMDTLTDLWTPCSLRVDGQSSIGLLSAIERPFWIAYC